MHGLLLVQVWSVEMGKTWKDPAGLHCSSRVHLRLVGTSTSINSAPVRLPLLYGVSVVFLQQSSLSYKPPFISPSGWLPRYLGFQCVQEVDQRRTLATRPSGHMILTSSRACPCEENPSL